MSDLDRVDRFFDHLFYDYARFRNSKRLDSIIVDFTRKVILVWLYVLYARTRFASDLLGQIKNGCSMSTTRWQKEFIHRDSYSNYQCEEVSQIADV